MTSARCGKRSDSTAGLIPSVDRFPRNVLSLESQKSCLAGTTFPGQFTSLPTKRLVAAHVDNR